MIVIHIFVLAVSVPIVAYAAVAGIYLWAEARNS